jgi:hypothetical protein
LLLPLFTAKRQTIADTIMKTVCLPIEATWAAYPQAPQPYPQQYGQVPGNYYPPQQHRGAQPYGPADRPPPQIGTPRPPWG